MKKVKQFFSEGSFVYIASDFDFVESGLFVGFSELGNVCIMIEGKIKVFGSETVFNSYRLALLYSRFIKDETHFFIIPRGAKFALKKKVSELKIVDYVERGHFIRELDIIFDDFIADASSVFMTEFEVKSAELNDYTDTALMLHQTAILSDSINNLPVQSIFFGSKIMKATFTKFLN